MEKLEGFDRAQAMLQKASLIQNMAEVIVQIDPHDIDHQQLASLISDEAGDLVRYATELSDEIENVEREARQKAEATA